MRKIKKVLSDFPMIAFCGLTVHHAERKAEGRMAEGYLTTHVLDTARGLPAAGMKIALYRVSGNSHKKIAEAMTNADGRTDAPILPRDKFTPGTYELVFFAGAYLDATGALPESPRFLDEIPIRFGISDAAAHYHVPLLLSPFGYSTYRGS
jgi:5-hydroxyisourate hydrolase